MRELTTYELEEVSGGWSRWHSACVGGFIGLALHMIYDRGASDAKSGSTTSGSLGPVSWTAAPADC